jgi:alkylation response protein AidB-like acyl-CoA dehydrogenase
VYSAEAERYRREVQEFLRRQLPAGWTGLWALDPADRPAFKKQWRAALHESGYLAPGWPREYGGGGLSVLEQVVLTEEFIRARVPPPGDIDTAGINLLGPTLLAFGTEEQKRWFLPRTLSGEIKWAQGYSEPNAGSDLASLRTRAVLDGDQWRIDGQKVWTSSAHEADWLFVLCRTDPAAPRHHGISFLLVPVDQPGIEVRPIINMVGTHDLNEVFFTDARTRADLVVGEVNGGWQVASALLGEERTVRATTIHVADRDELDRIIAIARERGVAGDPGIRQRLAWCYAKVETHRLLGLRILTAALEGRPAGPEASMVKLIRSEYRQVLLELALEIIGLEATVPSGRKPTYREISPDPGAAYSSAGWVDLYLGTRPYTVAGGSSEILRNIIGERVLGLPREPRPAKS